VPRAISRAPLTQEPGEQVFDTWSHGGLDHAARRREIMLKVGLIVGSTRPNRFADIPVT
jgi:hypothetical protein